MQGSNRKNPGAPGSPNPYIQTPVMGPQNQNGGQPAGQGSASGLATARIMTLLNQIGDRLISSEQERIAMREALSDLENRSDMSERMFLTIEDKISKNGTFETDLVERQDKLEKLVSESAERLERAEALTEKIEEAIALQNRLARRLEKTSQDKARILTKIERIEEGVEKTREALNSKALIQLAEQVAANGWLPQAPAANDRLNAEIAAATPWWKRPYKMQAGVTASLLAAGVIGGLAISQMAAHWPAAGEGSSSTLVVSSTKPTAGSAGDVLPDHVVANETPAPQSTDAKDVAPYSDNALDAAMDQNADAIAADLNAITPGVAPATQTTAASVAPKVASAAPAAPATAPAATPAVRPAGIQDNFDVDAFIKAQGDRSAPLATRIKADPGLPPVVKSVEDKAFQGVPEAQHDLAAIYTAGHAGVTVDFKRAAAWFGEAAANGVANARYNLGVLYHQGLGVNKDVNKAIGWYRAAAKLNHPEAEYNLGIAYIEGIGTKYDPRMASKYFEEAARGGVLEAAYNLGLIYENGLLGDADTNEAVYWYKIASDSSPEARLALNQITRRLNMSESDVSRIVKEYGAVYKLPAKGTAANVTPPVKTGAIAAPLTSADQESPDDPAVIAKQIPALTKEETQNLLGSVHKDQAVIEQVQEQLIRMKLFNGKPDGVGGPDTEAAIRIYQKTNGLPVTGKPTEDLLVRMLASDIDSASGNNRSQGL